MLVTLKAWARRLKRDIATLRFASRDPAMPLLPKLLALATVAYALSPVDLIPDFIPVLGLLDDLVIVPLGIWLCLRLTPESLIVRSRAQAEQWLAARTGKTRSMAGLALVVAIWLACAWLLWHWLAGQ